ncbi:MAG: dihydroorotate dehydrogenase electron transfer subunit [Clostridiaceae bacterium]|nr:dihydroorotate dehydrogenase electron transfer subunit [Clostridiaceae bacterium]
MTIISEEITRQAKPGQFLNIRCADTLSTLLRRPISICDIDKEKKEVRFVFQVKGEGTRLLANRSLGELLDVLGPLGTSFTVDNSFSRPALIGGGIGVFPLLFLANAYRSSMDVFLGFRTKEMVVLEQDFKRICPDTVIATDDGSYGVSGYVTRLLEENIKQGKNDIVYACGPEPMLKKVQSMCSAYGIPCQLSLEQRMGCGIGACLVCACKIRTPKAWEYKHVCKDGPVFWGNEVLFDE